MNAGWRSATLRHIGSDNDNTADICITGTDAVTYDFTQTGCTYTIPGQENCVSSCP